MFRHFCLLIFVVLCPWSLWAGPVVLTTADGSLTIEGDLTSFDGELFRIQTEFGALTIDGGNLTCIGSGCPDPDAMVARVRVGGPADLLFGLMPGLLEVFAEREGLDFRSVFIGDAAITWELSNPDAGRLVARFKGKVEENALDQLVDGEVDLSLGRVAGRGQVRQDVVALDAMVPIVAPGNPRAMVTVDQLDSLLAGRTKNWSQLDGPDLTVILHLLEGDVVSRNVLNPSGQLGDAIRHRSGRDLADAVAHDPAALGLVPFSMMGNAVPLVISGACGLATPATRESIRAEDYPSTQPLFLHRIGARQPKVVRDFIAFARSPEAQPVIRSLGFVDQAIGRIAFERQGARIANAVLAADAEPAAMASVRDMIGVLMTMDRLTLTFRFQDGSSDLDPQSATNVLRLADAIGRGAFDGRELVFIGFTDGVGPADGNQRLSKRRARSVLRAVSARVDEPPVTLSATGFGESLPMACDDTVWGKQVNRRVEVWVR